MKIDKTLINKKGFSNGCSAYKNGICEDTKENCDLCYKSSMKVFEEELLNESICGNCEFFVQHGIMGFDGYSEICSNKNSEYYNKELNFDFGCKKIKIK